jgi:hypothetical protein
MKKTDLTRFASNCVISNTDVGFGVKQDSNVIIGYKK